MPRVIDGLVAAEAPGMLGDDLAVLADDDAIGVGMDLDRTADGARRQLYLLLSKRTRQVFDTDAGTAWKPSNGPR